MNTPAVNNPVIALSTPSAKAPVADTSTPEQSFNQVLSREVADRNNTAVANNQQASEKTADKTTDTTTAQSADETKSEDAAGTKKDDNSTSAAQLLVLVTELGVTNAAPATETLTSATNSRSIDAKTDAATMELQGYDAASARTVAGQSAKTTGFAETINRLSNSKQASQPANNLKQTTSISQSDTLSTVNQSSNARPGSQTMGSEGLTGALGAHTDNATIGLHPNMKAMESDALAATTIGAHANNATALASLQQIAMNNGQIPGSQTDKLTPQVGTPAWNQALGQKVTWMLNSDIQSASLTLNPPDLGPLQVVLNVSNNHASASFTAAQPEVRQALEAALPRLREMLGDAGIQLGQTNVSAGTPQQQGSFGGQQQATGGSSHGNESIAVSSTSSSSNARVMHIGLVDTFA